MIDEVEEEPTLEERRRVRFSLAMTPEERRLLEIVMEARGYPDISTLVRKHGVDEPLVAARKVLASLGQMV